MHCSRTVLRLGVIGVAASLVWCCSQPSQERKPDAIDALNAQVDQEVFAISPELALQGVLIADAKGDACRQAKALRDAKQSVSTPQQPDDPLIADILSGREEESRCAAFTLADQERAALFATVKQTRSVPDGLYVLSVFESVTSPTNGSELYYRESEIGPIRTVDTCQKVETILREGALPTRACRAWRVAVK
jgi:hypothetical protein